MNRHTVTRENAPLHAGHDPLHALLPRPETTRAAEGMPRRAWRRAEIEAMVAAGILDEDERFELIGGEVVPMSPKGARHEWVKAELNRHLMGVIPREYHAIPETTLWLDDTNFVEPDFCVFPHSIMPTEQGGHDVVLAIEIADTSLSRDLGRKIGTYAAFGVAEVWVINALTLVSRVHRALGAEGFRTVFDVEPDLELVADRAPSIRVSLTALGLKPA